MIANTFLSLKIRTDNFRPALGNKFGGMVSPALKPIVLRMVYQVAKEVNIPVIGVGGVTKAEDVVEYMLASAHAVGIGYAGFRNPTALTTIIDDLETWCDERGIEKVTDLIGAVKDDDMERWTHWSPRRTASDTDVRCHQFSVERGGDGGASRVRSVARPEDLRHRCRPCRRPARRNRAAQQPSRLYLGGTDRHGRCSGRRSGGPRNRQGETVFVGAPNRAETVIALLAASRDGYVCCPSPHRNHTVAEIGNMCERASCAVYIHEPGHGADADGDEILAAIGGLASLRHIYRLGLANDDVPFAGLLRSDISDVPAPAGDPDLITYLAFTSGSTGCQG